MEENPIENQEVNPIENQEPTPQPSAWDGIEVAEEYATFKDKYKGGVNDVFKALANANKLIGQKSLVKPTEESSDEDKQAWRKHIGVPENVSDYDFELGEDIAPYLDKEFYESAKQKAHEIGLTKEQFEAMANMRFEEFRNVQESIRNQAILDTEKCRMALKKEWGEDADAFTKEAISIVKDHSKDLYDTLSQRGILNNPEFLTLLHSVADAMNEGGVPSQNTLSTIDSQLKVLRDSDAYKNMGHKDHMATMRRIAELSERKAKSIPR